MRLNKVIFKYPLIITERQMVSLPEGFEILSIQEQNGMICMWALVDPTKPSVNKTIFCIGTGNYIMEEPGRFIDTIQTNGFVWHFFEEHGPWQHSS